MRAILKSVFSYDIDVLDDWKPGSEGFSVALQLTVGGTETAGEQNYQLVVCDPLWLSNQLTSEPLVDGRHHLIVAEFDWQMVRAYIHRRVNRIVGEDWRQVDEQLSQFALSEFEGYRE